MARRVMVPVRCGVVQIIHVHWDKSARGGQGARARAAVPQAFEVESEQFVDASGKLCVETTHWGNRNGFTEPLSASHQRVAVAEGFEYGCVSVAVHEEGLRVRFQYSYSKASDPDRWFFNSRFSGSEAPHDGLLAQTGDWVRVCYNGQYSDPDMGNWWYQQVTVNVAWFDSQPNGRVFLDHEPSHELRALGSLR